MLVIVFCFVRFLSEPREKSFRVGILEHIGRKRNRLSVHKIAAVLAPDGFLGKLARIFAEQKLKQKPLFGENGTQILRKISQFSLAQGTFGFVRLIFVLYDGDSARSAPIYRRRYFFRSFIFAARTDFLACFVIAESAEHLQKLYHKSAWISIARRRQAVPALPRLPRARIHINFGVRLWLSGF